MPRLLEDLQPGTAVLAANGEAIGEVRGVYGLGEARAAEYLLVYWNDRAEEALLDAEEVSSITNEGVLLRSSGYTYADLPAFQPSANPMLHKL
jgi:hypothetical protein